MGEFADKAKGANNEAVGKVGSVPVRQADFYTLGNVSFHDPRHI